MALHELTGSDLQDVYVEGLHDKFFFEHFLIESGLPNVGVYEIATVEVATSEVIKRGLEDGERGRVVALACLLEDQVELNEVVCIADADFDHFKKVAHDCALLLLSDYSSLELYAFNDRALSKLFRLVARGFPKRPDDVLLKIQGPLQSAFLIRMANQDLGIGGEVPDLHRFCAYDAKKDQVAFRENDYIVTMTQKREKGSAARVTKFVQEQRVRLIGDARKQIHGYDFCEFLGWFIRQHAGFTAIHPTTIPKYMTAIIECPWLAGESLFDELLKRLKS